MKKAAVFSLIVLLVISLVGCGTGASGETTSGKIKVSVSFNALKEFAAAVGGDKVEISTIIPDGTEPHDFEPKALDLVALSSASVFIYNGFGLEPWAEDSVSAANNKELIVVVASDGVTPITNIENADLGEHSQYDPHIWLSLKCAETVVSNIQDALIKADPGNKDYYEDNCDSYISQLEDLYNVYSQKFTSVEKKSFVTGHAAFAYLCRDFGLSQNSVEDVFASGEPTAKQLTELIEYCKSNDVTTVFAEEMASPEVSETLANEVGAELKTIYTIASSENGGTYLDRMASNLSEIYESLSA